MATPLEDYLKMSTQDRQGVDRVRREGTTPYQLLQKPQFVQDVRDALPHGAYFDPAQIDRAIASLQPQTKELTGLDPEKQRALDDIRSAQIASMRDPSFEGSPEAWRAGLGLAESRPSLVGLDPQNPLARVSPVDGGDEETPTGPRGPGGPAAPRGPSIYDMQKGQLDRLLASQMEGFGQQRDLAEQLTDLREQGLAGQEQFAQDTASAREKFLEEQNATRQEKEQQRALERETQKNTELARQRTQLDEALRATGVDTNAATSRLESLGIDPGQFADRETNETTAMLYSQSMSSANFVNQMDAISQSAAQFASDANDQATAAAMFGIGQDLAATLQSVNQARQQGLIDDAMAMQAIADQERLATQQYDLSLTSLNVDTAKAAQAAAASAARAAEKKAAADRKIQVNATAMAGLQAYASGKQPSTEMLYAFAEAGLEDAFLDITSGMVDQDEALGIIGANLEADLARDVAQFELAAAGDSPGMVLPGGMPMDDFVDIFKALPYEYQADYQPYIDQILQAQMGVTE